MTYTQDFIQALIHGNAVTAQNIVLPDGRHSTYDIALGQLSSGEELTLIQQVTVEAFNQSPFIWGSNENSVIYGIPDMGRSLARDLVLGLYQQGRNTRHAHGRKAPKAYGPGDPWRGGKELVSGDRVYCLDDVLCTGESMMKEIERFPSGVTVGGIFVLIDRQERREGQQVSEFLAKRYNTRVVSACTIDDIRDALPEEHPLRAYLAPSREFALAPYDFQELQGVALRDAARDVVRQLGTIPFVNAESILSFVSTYSGIPQEKLQGTKRTAGIVMARFVAYYLLHRELGVSLTETGRIMRKDHTTILHGVRFLDELLA